VPLSPVLVHPDFEQCSNKENVAPDGRHAMRQLQFQDCDRLFGSVLTILVRKFTGEFYS